MKNTKKAAKNVAVTGTGVAVMASHYQALAPVANAKVEVANNKASKLADMLAQANATPKAAEAVEAPKTAKVKASSSKNADGTNRQRRNYEVTTRKMVVFTSETAKACFVATNLAFTTKGYDAAIAYAKRDKALVKRAPMFAEADLVMTILDEAIPVGADLADAKARIWDKYSLNYAMQCKRGKGNANVTSEVLEEANTAETNEEAATA